MSRVAASLLLAQLESLQRLPLHVGPVEVGLAHCPVDHGELEAGTKEKEERKEAVEAEPLLAGHHVYQAVQCGPH